MASLSSTATATGQTLPPGPESDVSTSARPSSPSYLVVIAGPARASLPLRPDQGTLVLGRHESCDLHLPGAEQVSRRHAHLTYRAGTSGDGDAEGGKWWIADAGSRWGTFVNGHRLAPDEEMGLRSGDQVRIAPWTFRFGSEATPQGLHVPADDDVRVQTVDAEQMVPLQADRLGLLLTGSAALHDAKDERDLAERLLQLARQGTRLENGAVLRSLDRESRYELLARSVSGDADASGFRFSRSLLDAARTGDVAEVRTDDSLDAASPSIVQMQITRALCVPVKLGETVAMFLYLDQRGDTLVEALAEDQENAVAFCVALSQIASLALSNLKRVEMERRAAEIDADLQAAAAAQRWILPRRQVTAGVFEILGESRPGRGVGGDFFDLIELGPRKVAVALGDVSGKGVAAGVLMTATQGFLHALLADEEDLARVARQLNAFIHPRRPGNRFVTLWIGLFDGEKQTLTYVDAGHGLAILCGGDSSAGAGGRCVELTAGGGLPIGVMDDAEYVAQTVPFRPGDAALVISDGIIEQPADGMTATARDEFGLARTRAALVAGLSTPDPITSLFDAVIQHAATPRLADDATAVLVRG